MCHDGNWVEVISWLKRQVWVVADWSGEKDDSALKNQTHTRKERYRQAFEKSPDRNRNEMSCEEKERMDRNVEKGELKQRNMKNFKMGKET